MASLSSLTSPALKAPSLQANGAEMLAAARQQSGLATAKGGKSLESVRQAAQEFEAFFASQMLQPMFAGVETNEMFGGGVGEDSWKSLMIDQYGKELARSGRLGITDQVMAAMLQAQEAASGSTGSAGSPQEITP